MHNRKLVLGGVALTRARNNRHDIAVGMEIMDELERLMLSTGYLVDAPFRWVGLVLRYGLKNEEKPHYQGIDKKDGELALAIELDTHELQHASREKLKERFMVATLKSLVDVGKKYGLSFEKFAEMLAEKESSRLPER